MPSDALENLVRLGELHTEPPSDSELDGLIRSGLARRAAAGYSGAVLRIDSRSAKDAYHCARPGRVSRQPSSG